MTTRAAVVAAARRWVGTPFHHQASLRGVGVDCVGLLVGVALELGIVDARPERRPLEFNGYGRQPDPKLLRRACDYYLQPIAKLDADLGDVLIMGFVNDQPQHFAIISEREPRRIIHAHERSGKVVENTIGRLWSDRALAAYRFPGVDD